MNWLAKKSKISCGLLDRPFVDAPSASLGDVVADLRGRDLLVELGELVLGEPSTWCFQSWSRRWKVASSPAAMARPASAVAAIACGHGRATPLPRSACRRTSSRTASRAAGCRCRIAAAEVADARRRSVEHRRRVPARSCCVRSAGSSPPATACREVHPGGTRPRPAAARRLSSVSSAASISTCTSGCAASSRFCSWTVRSRVELLAVALLERGEQRRAEACTAPAYCLALLDQIGEAVRRHVAASDVQDVVERAARPPAPGPAAAGRSPARTARAAADAGDVHAVADLVQPVLDPIPVGEQLLVRGACRTPGAGRSTGPRPAGRAGVRGAGSAPPAQIPAGRRGGNSRPARTRTG